MGFFETTILLITFLISLSIVWSALLVGITPVPSSRKARKDILKAADLAPPGSIIELGSGWGNLALELAKKYPDRMVIGYEISTVPWLVAVLLKSLSGRKNLRFLRRNFLTAELPDAALYVCYLYPGGMTKLAEKFDREQPQSSVLISNTFALPGKEPERIIRLDDLYKSPIYVYRLRQEKGSDIQK